LKFFFKDLGSSNDCFKIVPDSCKYEGEYTNFYKTMCKGYDEVVKGVHDHLIELSVVVDELNPVNFSGGIAHCIK